jgi:hypothetical protein
MAKRAFSRAFDAIPTTGLEQVTVRGSLVGTEHAARSQNLARDIVARVGPQNVKSITYNRSLSTTFSGVTDMRRPDVIVELKNGDVILGEIASGSQTAVSQERKVRSMSNSLTDRKVEGAFDHTNAKDAGSSSSNGGGGGLPTQGPFHGHQ